MDDIIENAISKSDESMMTSCGFDLSLLSIEQLFFTNTLCLFANFTVFRLPFCMTLYKIWYSGLVDFFIYLFFTRGRCN